MTEATEGRDNLAIDYLRETRSEMRKVVWPSREEATSLTVVVLFVTIAMTVLLGGLDVLFTEVIKFLIDIAQG